MRRDAVRQVQHLAQPVLLRLAEVFDLHEAIGPADDREDAQDDDVAQRMEPRPLHPRVGQTVEGLQEGRHVDLSRSRSAPGFG